MSQIDINGLLAQMRTLGAQLQPGATAAPVPGEAKTGDNFGNVLKQSIEEVAKAQSNAQTMSAAFDRGDPGTDLPQVMLSIQKAQLSFQAMTQIRNKLVSAYNDIMNMPM